MAIALINGKSYSHSNIVFQIAGVPILSLSDISATSSQVKEFNYGTGALPVSYGIGKKNPGDLTFTLSLNDVHALELSSPNGDIKDLAPFDIPLTILNGVTPYLRTFKNVMITEVGKTSDTETTDIKVSITAIYSHEKGVI